MASFLSHQNQCSRFRRRPAKVAPESVISRLPYLPKLSSSAGESCTAHGSVIATTPVIKGWPADCSQGCVALVRPGLLSPKERSGAKSRQVIRSLSCENRTLLSDDRTHSQERRASARRGSVDTNVVQRETRFVQRLANGRTRAAGVSPPWFRDTNVVQRETRFVQRLANGRTRAAGVGLLGWRVGESRAVATIFRLLIFQRGDTSGLTVPNQMRVFFRT
jgi:hypothetical protein